ncbi:hypothetical protein N9E25_04140 [Verrucomicrobiales bacterium]|jgi:D-alanine-D-alanine ligase|nr:hypothetical protein [Verrucomicrobiales bacterium]MDA9922504.1 hypothetical protein [Verrucomicrobiales bacterium]MDB2496082.1 hypothetical protein [Verrucomicrobiales bacterium]
MKIEIITTSTQNLRETGFGGIVACDSILESLQHLGHDTTVNLCRNTKDLDAVAARNPDIVVLAVKYLKISEDEYLWLADYFGGKGINHTGSLRQSLEFDSNKVAAKRHLNSLGIPTAAFFTALPQEYACAEETPIAFPFFIKPIDAANGNGVDDLSYVDNFPDFQRKVLAIYEAYGMPSLIEQYMDGPEYTVSIIQSPGGELMISAMEILPPESRNGLRILGAKVKRDDSESLFRIEDRTMEERAMELAAKAFQNLGARDFGRIDIKSTKAGKMFFLEANLVPGMTRGSSYFPRACEVADGHVYDWVVCNMLEGAFSRTGHAEARPNRHMEANV